MTPYDFDTVIPRKNTNSIKYDFAEEYHRPKDILPLWIADMDFAAPKPVLESLHHAVDHGIFGYSEVKANYFDTVSRWFSHRFHWQPQEAWLVKTPGIVFALSTAIRSLTQPGDSILIQPPVYHPFFSVIRHNNRIVAENRLIYQNGTYTIDFDDFEQKIIEQNVKLFLLCSPHNPVGRVWSIEELRKIGEICKKHHVFIVSDEIHCDFAFEEHPHHIFLTVNPDLADQTILCTAPSKTFNLAGLQVSNIWIPGESARTKFHREMDRIGYSHLNTLGLTACHAAYASGEPWLEQCRYYLRDNLDFLKGFLNKNIPQIKLVEPEGTYFAWLDCSALELNKKELNDLITNKAKLWLSAGHTFGEEAEQFQRMVLACPRSTLEQALHQLKTAVDSL